MENEEKEVFTAEEIKEQAYEEIIKDVIEEIDSREENLKVYYPYFIINKKLQDEENEIDLNSVFIAILSYLLYTGKLNNRKIEYQDIVDFTEYFIYKIYNKKKENVKEILIHADHSYNNKKILLSKIVAQYIESIYNE